MQALILAAGRGSRLGAITDLHPKGLTPLAGHPLLEWQLDAINGAGIEQVAAATGYLPEQIGAYLDNTFFNAHWQHSNMVRSLWQARDYLSQQDSIISYSDIIYSQATVAQLSQAQGDIVISYDPNWLKQWQLRFENPLDDAESFKLNAAGKLIEIGQKADNVAEIQGQYMGLLKFTSNGWQQISDYLKQLSDEQLNKLDMTALINQLLAQGINIDVCAIQDNWFEIDDEQDLLACERQLSDFNWTNRFIDSFLHAEQAKEA